MSLTGRHLSLPALIAGIFMLSVMLCLIAGCPKPAVEPPNPELLSGDPGGAGPAGEPTGEEPEKPALKEEDEGLAEKDPEGVPDEMKPGEPAALEAALADYEDWVGRVEEHADDWSSAVVWVGPPESEFVWALHLEWNAKDGCYNVTAQEDIKYGEE